MSKQGNVVTLVVAVLGAVKIVLDAFGYPIIDNDQINAVANGIAALVTVGGVILNHFNHK